MLDHRTSKHTKVSKYNLLSIIACPSLSPVQEIAFPWKQKGWPVSWLQEIVQREHEATHWGKENLLKRLKKVIGRRTTNCANYSKQVWTLLSKQSWYKQKGSARGNKGRSSWRLLAKNILLSYHVKKDTGVYWCWLIPSEDGLKLTPALLTQQKGWRKFCSIAWLNYELLLWESSGTRRLKDWHYTCVISRLRTGVEAWLNFSSWFCRESVFWRGCSQTLPSCDFLGSSS